MANGTKHDGVEEMASVIVEEANHLLAERRIVKDSARELSLLFDGRHHRHLRVVGWEETRAVLVDLPDLLDDATDGLVLVHRLEVTDDVAAVDEDGLARICVAHALDVALALGAVHVWVFVLQAPKQRAQVQSEEKKRTRGVRAGDGWEG